MRANPKAYAELVEIYASSSTPTRSTAGSAVPVLDITELSIEETASRVVKLVEERKRAAGAKQ
jgi:regulator of PEP synthase PpsR (kinase-PPPase family)